MASMTAPLGPNNRATNQDRITRRARDFDLISLIRVLARAGYELNDILFESNMDSGSINALVHEVIFKDGPPKHVVVRLNLGLHDQRGLLPSYFMQIAEGLENPDPFFNFLRFFDNQLLRSFISLLYVELDQHLYESWDAHKIAYAKMVGLDSVSGLSWLFSLYFPELKVVVERQRFKNALPHSGAQTGHSVMDGSSTLGKHFNATICGFLIILYSRDEKQMTGSAWPLLVTQRMSTRLLPKLKATPLWLKVVLVVEEHASSATLGNAGFLGFEKIRTSSVSEHQITVFNGSTAQKS